MKEYRSTVGKLTAEITIAGDGSVEVRSGTRCFGLTKDLQPAYIRPTQQDPDNDWEVIFSQAGDGTTTMRLTDGGIEGPQQLAAENSPYMCQYKSALNFLAGVPQRTPLPDGMREQLKELGAGRQR